MDISVFKFLPAFWCAIIITAVAVAVSTWYTVKLLIRLRNGKKIKASSTKESDAADETSKGDVPSDGCDNNDNVADDKQTEETYMDEDAVQSLGGRDPLDYCSHIQGEVKRVKQRVTTKKIQENLTKDQLDEERKIQSEQLEYIFKLMAKQGDKFGITSMDDVQQQMKLYA